MLFFSSSFIKINYNFCLTKDHKMNETSSFENFIIKSEYENNKAQKLNSNNLAAFNQTQYKSVLDNDDDIIWIFDEYNEQKIDDNVFIDLTNDDHLNLLLDSNNLDLFNNTPTLLTPTYQVHNLSTITTIKET